MSKNKDKAVKPSISKVWSYMDDGSKIIIVIIGGFLALLLGSLILKLTIDMPVYIGVIISLGILFGVMILVIIARGIIYVINDIKQSYKCALSSSND